MKKIKLIILVSFFVLTTSRGQYVSVIPQPLSLEMGEGSFKITEKTPIITHGTNNSNALYLQRILHAKIGQDLTIKTKGSKGIVLHIDTSLAIKLGDEGYRFIVNNRSVTILSSSETGIFYGIQTLRQLLPQNNTIPSKSLELPILSIEDQPRFSWRAFMLDESRHFHGMEQVKKLLDQMALLKMNVFHWHLTDDQGWRIEIKKYPKLTEVGAFRKDTQIEWYDSNQRSGEAHGGFYTQEQIKEIIRYASERQIKIVPEIEMPGHASAAIAAYPWLGTIGELSEVPVTFGKLPDSYNVADPKVYEFLEDVLEEVMILFPSEIIHIGGDEVKFDAWKKSDEVQNFMQKNDLKSPADLQIFFTNKISTFIDKNHNRMMGWNDILGGNVHAWQKTEDVEVNEKLAENTIIHFWKGSLDLITEAVSNGYDIVNSHHVYTYLDYKYTSIPIEKAYAFEPIPADLDANYHSRVLGCGCQMWSEWIPKVSDMDKKVFPRLAAYAEVGWTAKSRKDFAVFRLALDNLIAKWKSEGISVPDKFSKSDFKD